MTIHFTVGALDRPPIPSAVHTFAHDRPVRAAMIKVRSAKAVKDLISRARDDPWRIVPYAVISDTNAKRLELVVQKWGARLSPGPEYFRTRLARATPERFGGAA